jgi:PAS domain S-box-containing protein
MFRKLVEGTNAVPWEIEAHSNRFSYVGPQVAKLLGFSPQEWYNEDFWINRVHPEDRAKVRRMRREASARQGDYEFEYRVIAETGHIVWVRDVVHCEVGDNGTPKLRGFCFDITERKRSREELERSREQLRALSARLQEAREQERIHIAREIHDEFGQALTAIKMEVSWLERHCARSGLSKLQDELIARIASVRELVDQSANLVRRVATELRPPALDEFGLIAAIEWQAQEFEKRFGIRCHLEKKWSTRSIDRDVSTAIFRIFQEVLTNVARHSGARRVWIGFRESNQLLILEVADDGCGITPTQVKTSLGILGMRERASAFGGEFRIRGTPGRGTTVIVRIPLRAGRSTRGGRRFFGKGLQFSSNGSKPMTQSKTRQSNGKRTAFSAR